MVDKRSCVKVETRKDNRIGKYAIKTGQNLLKSSMGETRYCKGPQTISAANVGSTRDLIS